MAIVGTSRTFDNKFSFIVRIAGFFSAGFEKMSALEAEVADIKYYEGGALIPNKSAGRAEFKDITLERGATRFDRDMLLWFSQVLLPGASIGFPDPLYKRALEIVQKERDGTVTKVWGIWGAWPKQLTVGDWDNTVDEKVIEKLVLCYDYFTRIL